MKQKDTQVKKMYKDILKRKKGRLRQTAQKERKKDEFGGIQITGDKTGELAYTLRQAEREKKTEATEEAKKVQSYLSLDLSNELEGMGGLSFSDELKKLVDRLASESEFYFESGSPSYAIAPNT